MGSIFLALNVSGVVELLELRNVAPLETPLALERPLELILLDIMSFLNLYWLKMKKQLAKKG